MRKIAMKKIATMSMVLFGLAACMDERGLKQGRTETFIRYYNGGNNDAAQAMEITADGGFIILANTRIQKAEADVPHYKIKLIKTDASGNPVWTKLFPDINTNTADYISSGLQINSSGGYVIAGDDIQSDLTSKSLLLTVDESGNQVKVASYGTTVRGRAVAVDKTSGNFLMLSVSGAENMYLSSIDKTTFLPANPAQPVILYSAGDTNLSNKLFIDDAGKAVWAGVVTKNGLTGIRVIKTLPNNVNTDFDLLISEPGFDEVATDFCKYGFGYAITGSTNRKDKDGVVTLGADTDILFKLLAADGTLISSESYPFGDNGIPDNQNDIGNSISTTSDGGLILLSSVNSAAIKGAGDTDYYLIKFNVFGGKPEWTSSFGSKYKDDAVTVRQTSDGGYAVLGTSTQGGLKIVTLIKTNRVGKVE